MPKNDQQIAVKKRLIDADALTEVLEKSKTSLMEMGLDEAVTLYTMTGLNMAQLSIAIAPAVDAVEVVRCQECRYFDPKADGTVGFCKCGEVCGYCHSMRVATDFCSYGERRDDHAAD